jgi:hypothetical protein
MYNSIWDAVRKIRQTEGVAAFYKVPFSHHYILSFHK